MSKRYGPVLALLAALATMAPASHAAISEAAYTMAGTVVAKQANRPAIVDEGGVVCRASTGEGVGGACLSFGVTGRNSVLVKDQVSGTGVAFQVCVDNDGDSRCVSPSRDVCGDDVFFSHDDRGTIFNPLGPLPIDFRPGCPGGPFRGYVVFICNGVHDAGGAHSHPATRGSALLAGGGSGFGNFCGGSQQAPSDKPYAVVS